MKIGIMVSRQIPEVGGGFTYDQEILQALCRLRGESPHQFHLLGYQPNRPAHLDASGLPWISLHRPKGLRRRQKFAGLLQRLGLKKKSRSLDYESYPGLAGHPLDLIFYPAPQVRPIADIPYITNVWDSAHRRVPFFPETSHHGEWRAREKTYREVLGRAAYILTMNSRGKKEVVDYFNVDADRVRIFPLPTPSFALEEAAAGDSPKSLSHLKITGDYFFYPAQFWPHKNHICLLHALKILRDQHDYTPQLVLTGSDKGNRGYIQSAASQLGLTRQVFFPGFVSREDLTALYRQSIGLVYPSFFGPENLPPLEAFALGCPVIASRIPGHEEQLGDAALLIDPTQPKLWADAMQNLRQDSVFRADRIQRGRDRALRYTPALFVRALFALMDEFAAYRRCWPPA